MIILAYALTALGASLLLLSGSPPGPAPFQANLGQLDAPAKFVAHPRGYTLWLEPDAAVMRLSPPGSSSPEAEPVTVRMTLAGGRALASPRGLNLVLRSAGDLRGVPSFANVLYSDVYPGIDLVFRGDSERIEYDFIVDPGADPGSIRMIFDGIESARLAPEGHLVLSTRAGEVRLLRPFLYQDIGAARREIAGGFALPAPHEVGFFVGPYDARHPLVIDPEIVYSTYHGGCRGYQSIHDVAIDAQGNSYVTGSYPWDCDRGPADIFVSKFSPTGALLFRRNLGGHFVDEPRGIALDAAGNIFITGWTTSNGCCRPFPVVNAFQTANAGGTDAFVIKLDPSGQVILYSTFLGGAGDEIGADIEVDGTGRIHVTGRTTSTDFPLESPLQAALDGPGDVFVTVFDPTGLTLAYSTYLGGSGDEAPARMALSARGPVIAGTTSSQDFPTLSSDPGGPVRPSYGGGSSDAFFVSMSPTGTLEDSTYLGGAGADVAYGIAVGSGAVYLTGSTNSTDFPTASPLQPALSNPPEPDAFITKLADTGSSLVYSSYLQVSGTITCASPFGWAPPCGAVTVDPGGSAYVTAAGVFVTRVDPAGATRLCTFNGFGGEMIAVRTPPAPGAPEIFIAGRTSSFLFPTLNAFDSTHSWYETELGILTKLSEVPNPGADFEEDDSRIGYSGNWELVQSAEHSGGAAMRSMEAGARATITFEGTGLQVIGRRDPAAGIVRVTPSWSADAPNSPLDTYAAPAEPLSLLVSYSGLPAGTHTVTLDIDGTGNGRSSGAWVWIDGIKVLDDSSSDSTPSHGSTRTPKGRRDRKQKI